VGTEAGRYNQGNYAVAAGWSAGGTDQGVGSIAMGHRAGNYNQAAYGTALGYYAGTTSQGAQAVAVGNAAGQTNQRSYAVAVGVSAGQASQGEGGIAMGYNAGQTSQGGNAVALGSRAGNYNQGSYAIAIGRRAGATNQHANSIVLNASGEADLDTAQASSFYVKPVRGGNFAANALAYTSAGEIVEETGVNFDASGNVGIGTASPSQKLTIEGTGVSSQTRINGDGYVGRYYYSGVARGASLHFTDIAVLPADYGFNLNNGGIELGWSTYRWGQIYSTSSTISTSDRTKKQDITDISSSERKVASKIIPLLKTFRMKDAVAKKGDDARIHTGVIAQDLIAAFESEGLDAHRYGLFCYDEKWTVDGEHELSEIVYEKDGKREYTNEDGEVVTYTKDDEGVELVKYKIGTFADKDTPGAVLDSTFYSIRYEELLCFIVSVMVTNEELQAEKAKVATLETQLSSVLARLDALEAA